MTNLSNNHKDFGKKYEICNELSPPPLADHKFSLRKIVKHLISL